MGQQMYSLAGFDLRMTLIMTGEITKKKEKLKESETQ